MTAFTLHSRGMVLLMVATACSVITYCLDGVYRSGLLPWLGWSDALGNAAAMHP